MGWDETAQWEKDGKGRRMCNFLICLNAKAQAVHKVFSYLYYKLLKMNRNVHAACFFFSSLNVKMFNNFYVFIW